MWHYWNTCKVSSYVLQQPGWLSAYTIIPLRLGHFAKFSPDDSVGYNSLGMVSLGLACVHCMDFLTGFALKVLLFIFLSFVFT